MAPHVLVARQRMRTVDAGGVGLAGPSLEQVQTSPTDGLGRLIACRVRHHRGDHQMVDMTRTQAIASVRRSPRFAYQ